MKNPVKYSTILCCAILILCTAVPSLIASAAHNLDVHVHLWWPRPKQVSGQISGNSPSNNLPRSATFAAQNLISHMDRYGVAKVLIMPPPQAPENADSSLLDALFKISNQCPGRFMVAGGGDVLNPFIQKTAAGSVTESDKASFKAAAEDLVRRGIRAFGEMAALHLSFHEGHPFEMAAPDHPLFLLLADLAAQYKIPVDLHMEAVPADMPLPGKFLSPPNAQVLEANIAGLERLLVHNRGANIVWQHIGWDNTGHMTPALLQRLLAAHPNLFLALKVVERPQTMAVSPMSNRIVDADGKVSSEWLALMQRYPDRFMIGSDEFFPPANSPHRWPQSFEETWDVIEQLPADLARKISRENAARVYGF